MKFGAFIQLIPEVGHKGGFDAITQIARASDEYGLFSIWLADHLQYPTPERGAFEKGLFFEAWTTLSALSVLTRRVRLGTLVSSNPFRNPSLLAKMASTLDVISEGRLILGIGSGWFKDEALAYGFQWENHKVRVERMREAVEVIKSLWTKEKAYFKGRYYELQGAVCEPKPMQKPHPPIWVGGGSEASLSLAAQEAAALDVDRHASLDRVKATLTALKRHCDRTKRSVEVSTHRYAVTYPTRDRAVEMAKRVAEAINMPYERFEEINIIGSPEDCVSTIEKYSQAGFTHLALDFEPDIKSLTTFSEKVMQYFK